MLRLLGRGEWQCIQSFGNEFLVRHIGAIDGHRQQHATAIDQGRPLDAQLAAIGWVFARFFPAQRRLG